MGKSTLDARQATTDEVSVSGLVAGDGGKILSEWMVEVEAKVDAILEAIGLNHQRGPDGKCVEGCWSCRVIETMDGIRVSRRIQGR